MSGGYTVPDFGIDHDIKASKASEKEAEASTGHQWNPKKDADGNWIVPTALVKQALASKEKVDRPSCSSDDGYPSASGYCPKTIAKREAANSPYPMNYPVPNLGVDHDIIGTEASIKQAEGSVGHVWKPTENKDGAWNVPTALAP